LVVYLRAACTPRKKRVEYQLGRLCT